MAEQTKERVCVIFMSGPEDGKELVFERLPATLGRLSGHPVFIFYDTMVSRNHAEISWENGAYWLEDTGSRNGTYVNEKKIAQKTQIVSGDSLRVGDTWMKLFVYLF